MRTRVDSLDYFTDRVDIGAVEEWFRRKRAEGRLDLGYLQFFMTVLVRTLSQKPRLNRFVAGRRIYAREGITVSLALKKRLHEDSPETTVKLAFRPTDTVYDVTATLEAALGENKKAEVTNATDDTARLFMLIPRSLLRLLMAALRFLDFHGWLPRAIHRASPFHTSAFLTDLGSLGIKPVYHHLYDFGTTSLFVAFGAKERERELDAEGRVVERKYITIKVVNDERICDGHYYAGAFRYMLGLFRNPSLLELPPESVVDDVD